MLKIYWTLMKYIVKYRYITTCEVFNARIMTVYWLPSLCHFHIFLGYVPFTQNYYKSDFSKAPSHRRPLGCVQRIFEKRYQHTHRKRKVVIDGILFFWQLKSSLCKRYLTKSTFPLRWNCSLAGSLKCNEPTSWSPTDLIFIRVAYSAEHNLSFIRCKLTTCYPTEKKGITYSSYSARIIAQFKHKRDLLSQRTLEGGW